MTYDIKLLHRQIREVELTIHYTRLLLERARKHENKYIFMFNRFLNRQKAELERLRDMEREAFRHLRVDEKRRLDAQEKAVDDMLVELRNRIIGMYIQTESNHVHINTKEVSD